MIKFCKIDCCAELPVNNYDVYDIEVAENAHFTEASVSLNQ